MCLVRTCFKEIIVVFEEKPLIFLTKEIDEKIDATLAKYKVTANLLAQLILSQLSSTTKLSSQTEVNGSASLFYIAVCIHGAESLQFFWIQSQTEIPQFSLEDHLYEENETSSSCQHYYTLYHIFLLREHALLFHIIIISYSIEVLLRQLTCYQSCLFSTASLCLLSPVLMLAFINLIPHSYLQPLIQRI